MSLSLNENDHDHSFSRLSQSTYTSDIRGMRRRVGLGPFVGWRIARSVQKQVVHVNHCCCLLFG